MDEDEDYKELEFDCPEERNKVFKKFETPEEIEKEVNATSDFPKASYFYEHTYIGMIKRSINPLSQILRDFNGQIPVFSSKFLNELVDYVLEDPDEAKDLLYEICDGPKENLKYLPFSQIVVNLIENMPLSIFYIRKIFDEAPESCRFPVEFMQNGGLVSLAQQRRCTECMEDIADILYRCSFFPLKFKNIHRVELSDDIVIKMNKNGECSIGFTTGYNDDSINDFSLSDDENRFDFSLSDDERSEILFRDLVDSLLQTKQYEIIHLCMMALLNVVQKDDSFNKTIANTVIDYFKYFIDSIELTKLGLQILSESLKSFVMKPPFNDIWEKVPDILRVGDIELTSALCHFVSSAIDVYHPSLISGLEIFNDFVEVALECPYTIKEPIVICLAYILNNSSSSELNNFVTPNVICLFLDFIQGTSTEPIPDVLHALTKIAMYTEYSDLLQQIGDQIEEIEKLCEGDSDDECVVEARNLYDVMMSKKDD